MRIFTFFLLLFNLSLFAQVEGFEKRFSFQRDSSGEIQNVRIKWRQKTKNLLTVEGFWQSLKQKIKDYQSSSYHTRQFKADLDRLSRTLRSEMRTFSGKPVGIEEVEALKKSLSKLRNFNLQSIFSQIEKSGFIKKFQEKISEAFTFVDPHLIARPTHANFFYRRNIGNQVAKWAMDFIGKKFDTVPVLNTAIFLVKKTMTFVGDQRSFYQNMFLYYVQKHSPEELGLTKEEVDTIVSSIFESRIGLMGYKESKYAQENWIDYGFDKFYKLVRQGNARARGIEDLYTHIGERIGYAFLYVEDKSGEKIVNLFEKAHMFTARPAVSLYLKKPAKVLRERTLVYLAQFGLSFIPLPGIVKSAAQHVANSFYVDQGKTEGALVGFLEDRGEGRIAQLILRQSVNPFLFMK